MTSDEFTPGPFFPCQESSFNQQQRVSQGLKEVQTVAQERVMEEEKAKIPDTNSGEISPFGGRGGPCGAGEKGPGRSQDETRKRIQTGRGGGLGSA